jgi:hypothetical protein
MIVDIDRIYLFVYSWEMRSPPRTKKETAARARPMIGSKIE